MKNPFLHGFVAMSRRRRRLGDLIAVPREYFSRNRIDGRYGFFVVWAAGGRNAWAPGGRRRGAPAGRIDPPDFRRFLELARGLDFDSMVEIKDKEASALLAREILDSGKVSFLQGRVK